MDYVFVENLLMLEWTKGARSRGSCVQGTSWDRHNPFRALSGLELRGSHCGARASRRGEKGLVQAPAGVQQVGSAIALVPLTLCWQAEGRFRLGIKGFSTHLPLDKAVSACDTTFRRRT